MNKYILSTIAWVESIAKKEVEKQWWKLLEVRDRMVVFSGDEKTMIRVNLWSRVANKLYMVLWEWEDVDNFDKLYDLIYSLGFKKYVNKDFRILIKAKSISSDLTATPSIQKIAKKAIIDSITWKSWETVTEDRDIWTFEVMVLLINNKAYILLNTSWEALHKRWYRQETWEAPIKENLAAAIVILAGWRFKEPFYDMFCWSWTIPIEAAMIARNIAPGLNRYFAFETLWLVSKDIVENEIKQAKEKKFSWNYKIIASDNDDEVLKIAKDNAKDAGVDDTIEFIKKDFKDYLNPTHKSPHPIPLPKGEGTWVASSLPLGEIEWGLWKLEWIIVSNPPYWNRLKDEDLRGLYNDIDKLFRLNKELKWWIITSYTDFDNQINLKDYKKRKLYNWGDLCYFYKRK